MTPDETLAYLDAQVDAAAKLGFPVARYQHLAGPDVIRRLLPKAERLGVKLGLEIHSPEKVNSPTVLKYREMYAKEKSPYLGFIPDFGSAARRVSPAFLDYCRELALPEALTAIAVELWQADDDPADPRSQKVAAFQARAKAAGFPAGDMEEYFIIFGLFCRQEPRAWLEIMPQVVHIHGKFYHFAADRSESSIPYEEILPVFVKAGYDGFMSSEWEGHAFSDRDSFAMVQQHHALCARILAAAYAKAPSAG
ncbi:MAG TPA: sugar phosphate isomerase/epimerase [Patescibacteria group bacterium]|nr:sugar phosphate isomerase/epimerase [Patescibacteria group bacterium]